MIGDILWAPPDDWRERHEIGRFMDWLRDQRGLDFGDYEELRRWSITDLEGFWGAVADFYEVKFHSPYERVLGERSMPGAKWFPGATLNYAEHLLGGPQDRDRIAVLARSQTRGPMQLTFGELAEQVGRARAGLERLGVGRGDRVVAYLPNIPETLVMFIATASLGAIWATCAPEFGARSVIDRFAQIEPKVLVAVPGYTYRERHIDRTRRDRGDPRRAADPRARDRRALRRRRTAGRCHLVAAAARRGRRGRGRGVGAGGVRPPAVRAVLLRDDRPAEGDHPLPRRAAAWSTSRTRASSGTWGPARGCCGSRRPPG